MEKKSQVLPSLVCNYLFMRDGKPVCLFRVAEPQPCGYAGETACYYRGGPFTFSIRDRQAQHPPLKKNE